MPFITRRPCAVIATMTGVVMAFLVVPNSGKAASSAGKDLFEQRCSGCHALDSDKQGPRLRGVYGRRPAAVPSFNYSDALKNARIIWDADSLDKWLADPDKFIPDNDMPFRMEKADERRGIIDYLKML